MQFFRPLYHHRDRLFPQLAVGARLLTFWVLAHLSIIRGGLTPDLTSILSAACLRMTGIGTHVAIPRSPLTSSRLEARPNSRLSFFASRGRVVAQAAGGSPNNKNDGDLEGKKGKKRPQGEKRPRGKLPGSEGLSTRSTGSRQDCGHILASSGKKVCH